MQKTGYRKNYWNIYIFIYSFRVENKLFKYICQEQQLYNNTNEFLKETRDVSLGTVPRAEQTALVEQRQKLDDLEVLLD